MRTTACLVASLVLVAPALAQEKKDDAPKTDPNDDVKKKLASQKVTFNFDSAPFDEVVDFLRDFTGLNLFVCSTVKDPKPITLKMKDASVKDALAEILKSAGLDSKLRDGVLLVTTKEDAKKEDPKRAALAGPVGERLEKQRITINFDQTPVADALETLHDLTNVNYVMTGAARKAIDKKQKKVVVKVKDVTARTALDLFLEGEDLAYRVKLGAVLVETADEAKKDLDAAPKLEGELKKKLEEKKITFNFVDAPLGEVEQFLTDMTGVAVATGEGIDAEQTKVDLRVRDLSVSDALGLIAVVTGFEVVQKSDGVVISKRKEKKDEPEKK